jgi:hypothetical protein
MIPLSFTTVLDDFIAILRRLSWLCHRRETDWACDGLVRVRELCIQTKSQSASCFMTVLASMMNLLYLCVDSPCFVNGATRLGNLTDVTDSSESANTACDIVATKCVCFHWKFRPSLMGFHSFLSMYWCIAGGSPSCAPLASAKPMRLDRLKAPAKLTPIWEGSRRQGTPSCCRSHYVLGLLPNGIRRRIFTNAHLSV